MTQAGWGKASSTVNQTHTRGTPPILRLAVNKYSVILCYCCSVNRRFGYRHELVRSYFNMRHSRVASSATRSAHAPNRSVTAARGGRAGGPVSSSSFLPLEHIAMHPRIIPLKVRVEP